MTDELNRRGRALEEAFFNKRNEELLAKLRAQDAVKRTKGELEASTGIHDPKVLDDLIAARVDPQTLAALSLAPLVLVAWRDGKIETHERSAILRAAEQRGFKPGTTAYQLVEKWLESRPTGELRPAWEAYVKSLRERLPKDAYAAVREDILARTREVARAAGGILGIASLSKSEKAFLAGIEAALG
jgi:hypothetical protein